MQTPWLSEQEQRIAKLVAKGLQNKEIAEKVHLSEGTVKWYLRKMYVKLGIGQKLLTGTSARLLLALWLRDNLKEEMHS